MRRRRNRDDGGAAPASNAPEAVILTGPAAVAAVPAAVILDEHIEQPVEESVASFAKAPGPLGTSVAPVAGEVVDVRAVLEEAPV